MQTQTHVIRVPDLRAIDECLLSFRDARRGIPSRREESLKQRASSANGRTRRLLYTELNMINAKHTRLIYEQSIIYNKFERTCSQEKHLRAGT